MQAPKLALIDADLFTYDIPYSAEREDLILPFLYCIELCESRLEEILERTGCTDFKMYLTGSGNFRNELATIQTYKGTRKREKPFHYMNMRSWLQYRYNAEVIHGMEADDALSIQQIQEGLNTCIVSRDKDLRMVPGWHYSYGVGKQPEKPLEYISELGYLSISSKKKLTGGGLKWFYAQCIMGDRVDNIQGIPKAGDVLAYKTLNELQTEQELYDATSELYNTKIGESAQEAFMENAQLLWMIQELDQDQKPVMWEGV